VWETVRPPPEALREARVRARVESLYERNLNRAKVVEDLRTDSSLRAEDLAVALRLAGELPESEDAPWFQSALESLRRDEPRTVAGRSAGLAEDLAFLAACHYRLAARAALVRRTDFWPRPNSSKTGAAMDPRHGSSSGTRNRSSPAGPSPN
jgi:hypothetical protein